MRPDAYRVAPPGSPEAKPPGYLHPWAAVARAEEAKAAAEQAEQESLRADLEHLHRLVKDLRIDLALRRLGLKYSPDQPRVPAGYRDGGQWTSDGGKWIRAGRIWRAEREARREANRKADVQTILAAAKRLRLATSPQNYQKCLDLCYRLLERPLPRWSDRNTFDFHKCMNACLGRNL